MSPIAIDPVRATDSVVSSLKAAVKAATPDFTAPLPDHGEPVARDYMYKFQYNHELPTHGTVAVEVPAETDAVKVAEEMVESINQTLGKGDAEGFTALFLEHGVWRDRSAFTWTYRTFNFHAAILAAAKDLLPTTPVSKITLVEPFAKIDRPYANLSFVQAHLAFSTDKVGASALVNLILTPEGWRIWTLHTTIESLVDFPELPERDGHMTGDLSWVNQRLEDTENAEPKVLIVGAGQNGLMMAARLKALGVDALVVEKNVRLGDNWRGRYEALSLHLPHWADHFPYMPYPQHWPMYTPAQKLGDWFEWYVSALELHVWTSSNVTACEQDAKGNWTVEITRTGKSTKTFHPKQIVSLFSFSLASSSTVMAWCDPVRGE